MEHEHHVAFGPFRLDVTHGRLWRGEQVIRLRPRSLAMLRYLVEHPGRLVTKAELRRHVWEGTHVTDTVLRVSVKEIRAALGDAAAAPKDLEMVGRWGKTWMFPHHRRPGSLLDARAKSMPYSGGFNALPRAPANSFLSVARQALERRRWSTCS